MGSRPSSAQRSTISIMPARGDRRNRSFSLGAAIMATSLAAPYHGSRQPMTQTIETDVLIAGGGPCGLMLANELGPRGIRCLLVDGKPSTAFNPQANATQARTMEHYRRLGFAHEIRALGLPP